MESGNWIDTGQGMGSGNGINTGQRMGSGNGIHTGQGMGSGNGIDTGQRMGSGNGIDTGLGMGSGNGIDTGLGMRLTLVQAWTSVMTPAATATCRDDLPYTPLQVKVASSLKTLLARMKREEGEQVDGGASKEREEEIGG